MQKFTTSLIMLITVMALFTSCKSGIFGKKNEKSTMTGWNYNDKNQGSFNVSRETKQKTGPGLVFVQGGTFSMGATDEDVVGDWNNVSRRVTVASFYLDKTEVGNVHYREYLNWVENTFGDDTVTFGKVAEKARPDTLVWRSELAANEPMVEYYFRHPSYNYYPVVGVTWQQASDFCIWRGNRVNELILAEQGFFNKNQIKTTQGKGQDNFSTKSYLLGNFRGMPGKPKKSGLIEANGKPRNYVKLEDGILFPDYRLPTEAEWEYAAYGLIAQNPRPKHKEGKRGEELFMNRQVYSWSNNVNGLRESRSGTWQGKYMANFKRGAGDYMGVAGGLNDNSPFPGPIESFFPNSFGLYNMSGNVNEWVADVYRPLSSGDVDDLNPFRGNEFKKLYKNANGEYEVDSLGRMKYENLTTDDLKSRRNYQLANLKNFIDGDTRSESGYNYGKTSLISDKSRVYKGGGWNDIAYWLSPGTRRHLEEDQSAATIGFRCAMDRLGSQEGNEFKTGNYFSKRRQNARKTN